MSLRSPRAAKQAQRTARKLLKRATDHGSHVQRLGQFWAIPTMIAVSLSALIVFTGADVQTMWHAARVGGVGAVDLVMATKVLISFFVFVGVDLAIIIAAGRIQDGFTRGMPWHSATMVIDGLVVLVLGVMEGWTYYLLLFGLSGANAAVNSAWLLGARAAMAVITAVYLGTVVKRMPSERDVTQVAGLQAGELLIQLMQGVNMAEAGMGQLYQMLATALDHTLPYAVRAERLVKVFEGISPANMQREHQAQLAAVRADLEGQLRAAQDTALAATARADAAQADAVALAAQHLLTALLHIKATGTLPDFLTEQYPELAGLELGKLGGPGSGSRARQIVEAAPRTDADRQRQVLRLAGINSPMPAPKGRQGVWVSAADVATLTDGQVAGDEARELVRRLSDNGAKSKGQLVARFTFMLEDLRQRNLLSPRATSAYAEYRNVDRDSEQSGVATLDNVVDASLPTLRAASA